MTLQTVKQIMSIHILPNISRNKRNHGMTFGQLIEHNIWNNFLENWYTKCGGEAGPRYFYKNSKLSISQDQQSEML